MFLCLLGLAGMSGLPLQAATVETPGFLKYECWFPPLRNASLTNTDVGTLLSDPNYPNTPDMVSYAAGLDTRSVFPDDTHDQYGARLTGWITPQVTDDYNFYIRSDDASQLWISTDSTAANLLLVAEEDACCNPFMDPGNPQTTVTPIHLLAGQKYFIEILHKEGGGGDYAQVAWQSASGTNAAASLTPLVSTILSSDADPLRCFGDHYPAARQHVHAREYRSVIFGGRHGCHALWTVYVRGHPDHRRSTAARHQNPVACVLPMVHQRRRGAWPKRHEFLHPMAKEGPGWHEGKMLCGGARRADLQQRSDVECDRGHHPPDARQGYARL